jgi:hypothetical protein
VTAILNSIGTQLSCVKILLLTKFEAGGGENHVFLVSPSKFSQLASNTQEILSGRQKYNKKNYKDITKCNLLGVSLATIISKAPAV